MKIRFITPALHGAGDYAAAAALIVVPLVLRFEGLALTLSIAGGAGLILYSLLTDYPLGPFKLLSYKTHIVLDLVAAVAFLAAPAALGFEGLTRIYYFVMGAGVIVVVALSGKSTPRPSHDA